MTLLELYATLKTRFGPRADPDTWWPIFYGRTSPPEFERAITTILVQNSSWRRVGDDAASLDAAGLLTAHALATTAEAIIAACITRTGLPTQKARRLHMLGQLVTTRFGDEATFCARVTREELLAVPGIGEQTADRTLLYACGQLSWPVDTYCPRVLAHYHVILAAPAAPAEHKRLAVLIQQLVAQHIPHQLDDWQRLHALMQLEGDRLRRPRCRTAGHGRGRSRAGRGDARHQSGSP